MERIGYAVVRGDRAHGNHYQFGKWHDSLEDAKKEAERLCSREQAPFLILKLVGKAEVQQVPVKVDTWE